MGEVDLKWTEIILMRNGTTVSEDQPFGSGEGLQANRQNVPFHRRPLQ
jgi:hypothetical protein